MPENTENQPAITNVSFSEGTITIIADDGYSIPYPGNNEIQIPCLILLMIGSAEAVPFDVGAHRVSNQLLPVLNDAIDFCRAALDEYLAPPANNDGDSGGDSEPEN